MVTRCEPWSRTPARNGIRLTMSSTGWKYSACQKGVGLGVGCCSCFPAKFDACMPVGVNTHRKSNVLFELVMPLVHVLIDKTVVQQTVQPIK